MVFSFLLSNGISRKSTYTLKSANALANGGVYECTASNAAGRANSVQFTLLFDPKVTIALRNKLIDYGEDLTLTCEVTSYPAISLPVLWRKDGRLLSKNLSKDVKNANNIAVSSTVTIKNVTERDGGSYTCQGLSRAMISIGNHFAVHPQGDRPVAGSTVSLSCKVVGYPAGTIAWEVSKQRQKNYGGVSDLSKFRVTSERTSISATSHLTITYIQLSDTGYYRCQTSSASKEALSHPAHIDVITSPSIITPPKDVTVKYRQAAVLDCVASGYPIPKVTWTSPSAFTTRKSVETMGKITVTIDVHNENGADGGGEFECTASNGVGRGASVNATVSVKPKIIRRISRKQTVADGQTASSVECIAEGYPKPKVDWKLKGNDKGLKANSVTATTSEASSYSSGSLLSLGRVSIDQNGSVFVCKAENSAGSYSLNFTLFVTMKASFTVQPKDSFALVGGTVTLSCEAAGASARFVEWYKNGKKIKSNLSSSTKTDQRINSILTLSDVQLRDGSRKYICKVGPFSNLSVSVSSQPATVGILGKFSEETFKNQIFSLGSNVGPLACSFKANPRPSGGEVMFNEKVIGSLAKDAKSSTQYFWTFLTKTIGSISVQDGGEYTCIVRMSPTIAIIRKIQIGVAAFISAQPQPLVLDVGTTKSLSCKAKGFPVPLIQWTNEMRGRTTLNGSDRVDAAKRERTSKLTFIGDSLNQAGSYRCVATNVMKGGYLKNSTSSPVIVAVRPIITTRSSAQKAKRQTTETLECLATGYPSPAITWTFRRLKVLGAEPSSSGRVSSSSTLTRTAVSAVKDGGEYTCNAANSAGNSVPITLTLNFDPQVTTNPASRTLGYGMSTSLTCKVTSYPALSSPVKWLKDGALLPDSQSTDENLSNYTTVVSTLRVSNVTEETGGNYTCYESSKPAVVKVANHFVVNPRDVRTDLGKSVSLSCQTVGYPVGNIVWEVLQNQQTNYAAVKSTNRSQVTNQRTFRSETSTLTITEIELSDTAQYRCGTSSARKKAISKTAYIIASDVRFIVEPKPTYAKVGEKVTLSCEATGVFAKYISWFKDNEKIDSSASMSKADSVISFLTLSNVKLGDGSTKYFCKVGPYSDFLHSVASAPATVGILGNFSQSFRNRNFYPRGAPLVCSFSANPRPTSGEVRLNGKIIASLGKTAKPSLPYWWTVWTKPIKLITAQDGGRYTCVGRMGPTVKISHTIQIGIDVSISAQPKPIILAPEETKMLSCKAEGFPVPIISWIRKIGEKMAIVNNNEDIHTSQHERTSSLIFVGSNIDQAGSYQCVAKNAMKDSTIRRTLSSFVDVAVKPLILTQSSSQKAERETTQTLECLAIGYPLPVITWIFRGEYVAGAHVSSTDGVTQSSTLTRKEVDALKDGGDYTCSASNGAGSVYPMTVTLNFDPRVKTNPTSNAISYGGDLILSCQVTYYPAISLPIEWKKDGMLLLDSWSTDRKNSDNTAVNSTLRVISVKEDAGGSYSCHESSKQATIHIHNYFVVNPRNKTTVEGSSTTISCKVVGYPVDNIIWEVSSDDHSFSALQLDGNVSAKFLRGSRAIESALTLKEIRRTDSGYYRCETRGLSKKFSSREAHINVAYLDSLTLRFSGKTSVRLGNTFSLSCTAVGNPVPEIAFYATSFTLAGIPIAKEIKDDGNHKVTLELNGSATLTVSDSQTSDSGYYFCRAINLVGFMHSNAAFVRVTRRIG